MPDMLVNLLDIPPLEPELERMKNLQVTIRRALTPDKLQILEWVGRHSGPDTVGEADACFSRIPVSLFLATREKQIIGYACYKRYSSRLSGLTRVMDAGASQRQSEERCLSEAARRCGRRIRICHHRRGRTGRFLPG